MIQNAYCHNRRQNSTTEADDPDELYKRLCSEEDWTRANCKVRFENLVLKEQAIALGYSEDLWSKIVIETDPLTGKTYEVRQQFEYAISSRELLDITPT